MDLKRVVNLIQVAELGSFSKAASVIGISQPTLGRQVKKLEEECNATLLYRNGRGVSLTPDGERLLAGLRPLVRQMEAKLLEMHDSTALASGRVTIGLTPTLCGMLGLSLIDMVGREYPAIQLNIITGYSGYVHEWLLSERVDIGVLHDARRSQHLIVNPLTQLELSLVSATSGLSTAARQQGSVAFRSLQGLPLVLPTGNHGLRRTVESAAAHIGIELSIAYEIDDLQLMKEMVESGRAHTILSSLAVQREIQMGRLVARNLVEPVVSTGLVVASAANKPVTKAVRAVEQALQQVLKELLPTLPHSQFEREKASL